MATFPIPGYNKPVEPHWGQDRGGTDIFAPSGTPVVSIRSGRVEDAGYSDVGGWYAQIVDASGIRYYYAHLRDLFVQPGQVVAEGSGIGTVGDTGNAKGTGAHLHLGIGPSIQSGTGPKGGTGTGFDAVKFLNGLLGKPSTTRVDTSNGAPPPDPEPVPAVLPAEPTTETDPLQTPYDPNPLTQVAMSITQVAQSVSSVFTPLAELTTGLQPGGSVWEGLEILLWKLIATVILLVIALVGLVRLTGADPAAVATRGVVRGS